MNEETGTRKVEGQGIWMHFTIQDGLPDMKIESLFEDSHGVLWIGTHDRGLVRYEGDGFTTFSRRDGLVGSGVFSIIEDQDGYLWLGTSRGLSRFDGRQFETIDIGGVYSLLWGSCVDWDGWLWFGLERRPGTPPKLVRWNGKRAELVAVSDCVNPEGESIHKVVCDDEGALWVGGENLYRQVDDDRFERVSMPDTELGTIQDMLFWNDGSLWVAADKGVWCLRDGEWSRLYGVEKHCFIALLKVESDSCWLTTYDGRLFHYENGYCRQVYNLNAIIRGRLCKDKRGRLWIGTYGKGLFHYDNTRVRIFGVEQGLPSVNIKCLSEDSQGLIWVGTNKGLVSYNDSAFSYFFEEERLINKEITGMGCDDMNRLWISVNGTSYVMDKMKIIFYVFIDELRGYEVLHMVNGKDSKMWFGSMFGRGFGYWIEGKVVFFSPNSTNYPSSIGAIIVDKKGQVWFGSANPTDWNGLCCYDGKYFKRIDSVSDCAIIALFQTKDGYIWIGTNEGLCRFDEKDVKWFTQKDGLPCEIITEITEDEDGTLWIGTDGGGVCRFDGSVFQSIYILDNPFLNIINCIYQDKQGKIWFGTEGGLIQYIPSSKAPQVEISQVITDQRQIKNEKGKLKFSSDTHKIRFHFQDKGPQDYIFPLIYRYRLDGFDKEWRQGRDKEVEYSELKSGKYTFVLQAVDCDLNYSEMVDVKIEIAEDPWIQHLGDTSDLKIANESIGQSVLIIDEDYPFASILQKFLAKLGYIAEIVQNEEDVLKVFDKKKFDIVLLSYNNSITNNLGYLWKLKINYNNPEIIIFTNYAKLDSAKEMTRLGARAYLMKPSEPQLIVEQIERTLLFKRDPLAVYIKKNIGNIHIKEEVAKQKKMSQGTVLSHIKKATGFSFQNYLQLCRIEEAQKHIVQGNLTMQEIARKVGMAPPAFSRAFNQYTGRSPRQFQREIHSFFS